jgi:cell division protein FtsW
MSEAVYSETTPPELARPRARRGRGPGGGGGGGPRLSRSSILFGWWASIDRRLLGLCALLMTAGVLLAFGSSGAAAARLGYDEYHFVLRQVIFVCGAASVLVALSFLTPTGVKRAAVLVYGLAIVLMLVVEVAGHEAKGAARWIRLPGFSLQPSELLKPALIVLAAALFTSAVGEAGPRRILVAFGLFAVPVVLLLLQPDVGQTGLLTFAFLTVFYLSGMPLVWTAVLLMSGLLGIGLLYFVLPHFKERINTFLSGDPGENYQVQRALDAIASGGLLGQGPGEGEIKRILPDAHTDFIYSLAAEEFGLITALGIIAIFAVLVLHGLFRAEAQRGAFERCAAAGLIALVGYQAAINIAVNLNVGPTKGMTLPLISYGGSSLLGIAITLGFALALLRRRPGGWLRD